MRIFTTCLAFVLFTGLSAQITHPRISPLATVEQQLGLSTIKVVYSRPGVRGRKIIGDLVPYGRIWRVGANESTKFSVDTEVKILGNALAPGTYALYAFPGETKWEIVFHGNITHWGDGRKAYNPEEDIFRVEIIPEKLSEVQENFLITFDRMDHNSLDMIWQWEYTRITIPIEVDTDAAMMREISRQLEVNRTPQTYYEAGRYLQEQGKDPEIALGYLNKAIELGGDTYYYHRVRSLVQASLNDFEAAIESAQISLKLATELDKEEFVRMNQKNIDSWKKKIQLND